MHVDVDIKSAQGQLDRAAAVLDDMTPIFRAVVGMLEQVTDDNFIAQGRPSWVPLSKSTLAERLKRNRGGSVIKILQDSGILAASISTEFGADFGLIGAGGAAKDYAAIQQFGGTINRAPYSTKVRLRTDAKGNLLRQGKDGKSANLSVFAKDSHKRARESWHEVEGYSVNIPARPYLPFRGQPGSATMQPEAVQGVLDVVSMMLGEAFG